MMNHDPTGLVEIMSNPTYTWDSKRGRYRRNGRPVPDDEPMRFVDGYLDAKQVATADALFAQLRAGQISVKEAQLRGEHEIALAHLNAAMAAKGGRAQMTETDFERVGAIVRGELTHWSERMQSLAQGAPIDGPVKTSLRAYLAAAGVTYSRIEQEEQQRRGNDEYRNVLNDGARHCHSTPGRPSCHDVSARGWQPIGTLPERGRRGCHFYCKCRWEYRDSEAQTSAGSSARSN